MIETPMNVATEYLYVKGGRIAYEVVGQWPLVVLSPGLADTRSSYRSLAPLIADAGYRVASADLRGHGEASIGWGSYSRADTAADLMEVIGELAVPHRRKRQDLGEVAQRGLPGTQAGRLGHLAVRAPGEPSRTRPREGGPADAPSTPRGGTCSYRALKTATVPTRGRDEGGDGRGRDAAYGTELH